MKVIIPNALHVSADTSPVVTSELADGIFQVSDVEVVETMSTRSGGQEQELDVDDEQLLEITLDDGSRWYLGPEERAELLLSQPPASRGAQADGLVLDTRLFGDRNSRGLAGNAFRRVRVFSLKLLASLAGEAGDLAEETLSSVGKEQLSSVVIDPIAYAIARKLEKRSATKGISRLCRVVADDTSMVRLEPVDTNASADLLTDLFDDEESIDKKKPTLLLLHGTLSSTEGSFGDLWGTRPEEFTKLAQHYGDRIIALEHCTLTESPIKNALLVANMLPAKSRLHILSHSRGGLVGELLCRGTRLAESAFTPDEIELFEQQKEAGQRDLDISAQVFDALRQHYASEVLNLKALDQALTSRMLRIDRFVRVGCPARGTTLASGKLHRWSNRAFNAVGILGGQSLNPVYEAFQAFTLGVLKSNTKAEVLPGLQAQMPGSALIHVLNNTQGDVPADLSVVAGDIEISNRWSWKQVPLWLTDRFYGGANDLVVNTASMDGGAKRKHDIVALQVVGDHVNHFSYFSNADSATQLVKRLIEENSPRFEKLTRPEKVSIPRGAVVEHTGGRPVLLLVPGILGSVLDHDGKKTWVHAPRLLRGEIKSLSFRNQPPLITAPEVMDKAYGRFIQRMSRTHDVYVCPYDWRQSLTVSAGVLADRIMELLDLQVTTEDRQPIRIVAHSMGGLVTRMMIAEHRDLWDRLISRQGARFLMAGTPTNGSYSINRIVAGEDRLIKLLAFADLRNSKREITDLVAEFPGLATMLPGFGTKEWMQESTWNEVSAGASAEHWSTVSEKLLSIARRERQMILASTLDPAVTAYVAGQSDKTATDAFMDKTQGNTVCFRYTREGDGQVTWASGIPSGLSTVWYQPTVHGSLLDDPEYFEAWEELLDKGQTDRLSQTPPAVRSRDSDAPELWTEADTEVIDYLPDDDTLLEMALGMDTGRRQVQAVVTSQLNVEVAHGDLSFARFPVAVGHYEGDSILHAERALDEELDFRLSERQLIGQYPGRIGTSEVVFARSDRSIPEGALIIGLGRFGELSAASLERTITSGIIKYIFEFNDWWCAQERDLEPPRFGLSVLLIGSGIGSLTVRDSVGVLIRSAIAANKAFQEKQINEFRLLEHLEIVELWQDLALEAVESAVRWSRELAQCHVEPELRQLEGGRQRSRFKGSSDWWHTISVRLSDDRKDYLFDDYTRFARNELTREPLARDFVDRFLEQIIHSPEYDRNALSSPQQALFQLLLPRTIKEKSPDSDKLLLILDEATARIPWEMLVDGWSAKKNEPLAVSKTVVRRLSLEHFRIQPEPALGKEALVVGDPPSGSDPYLPLPGARAEAQSVARLLQVNRRYTVTTCISDDATDQHSPDMALRIIQALYSQEFRILHFAGHGSYYRETAGVARDCEDEGMIIGEGLRLTPTLVKKMPRTPTLVFLNCCHLGFTEQRTEETRVRYNHIAANLATQFIELGTQVVIAAGWEVTDDAAKRFAEVFYDNLLSNETLAHSITQARKVTYKQFPDSNTFGAYQCWGDPEFRLEPRRGSKSSSSGGNGFVSAYECELEALNIRNAAMSAKRGYRDSLVRKADSLLTQVRRGYGDPWNSPDIRKQTGQVWDRSKTRVLAKLGRAFGELGQLESAVSLLRAADRLNPTAMSVHDLEQLGNLECRCAIDLEFADSDPGVPLLSDLGSPRSLFRAGRARLKRLLREYERSEATAGLREIHCLLGGAAKRGAILQSNGTRAAIREALRELQHHYGTAWAGDALTAPAEPSIEDYIRQAAVNQEPPDQYAFVNFTLAIIVAQWFDDDTHSALPDTLIEQVRILTLRARKANRREESFWEAVELADAMLLLFLDDTLATGTGVFDKGFDYIDAIQTIYSRTNRRFGSMRQWASVEDHLDFVFRMTGSAQRLHKGSTHDKREEGLEKLIAHVKKLNEKD